MFFELREYRIKKEKRGLWVKLMDETIIPFQIEKGMTIIGSFISPEEEDLYIWIRRFSDENERKKLYDKVYGSDYWKKTIRPAMGDMLLKNRTRVTIMEATPGSALR